MTEPLNGVARVAFAAPEAKDDPSADADRAIVIISGKRYFTKRGLARELKKSERTIARWDALLIGPPRIVIGRMVLYDVDKIPAWLARHEREPPRKAGRSRGRAA
jgi:hypothetical protein